MKKVFLLLGLILFFSATGFGQNNLTSDQIRQYANELGVPYEALQSLVNSHKVQTGLTNPNANGAQLLSIQELSFMRDSDMLNIGSYYRFQALLNSQSGRTIRFMTMSPSFALFIINDVTFLVNVPSNTMLDVLISVEADNTGKPRKITLVEVVLAR